ncbi:MAG TPA: sulfur transferase domain-containing protein [Gemmatimonadales bacterium]|nr:sulfur transferase domain-containing protein [Gemmatimonadales bacterium]
MASPIEALRGVLNASQILPNVISGGQPGPAQLRAFHAAGGRVVVDIRAPMEPRGFDEAAEARALGLTYINIPLGPTPLTDQLMESILSALRDHAGEPTLFHCASGNRTGGPLIPLLILDHAMDEEDAVAVARRAGLRGAELLHWGVDYARRHGG